MHIVFNVCKCVICDFKKWKQTEQLSTSLTTYVFYLPLEGSFYLERSCSHAHGIQIAEQFPAFL